MEEMVSNVSVKTSIFQPCSFMNSFIYSDAFQKERRGLFLSADANWQFSGWRGKEQGPGETSGRKGKRLVLCALSVSWAPVTHDSLSLNCVLFHSVKTDI